MSGENHDRVQAGGGINILALLQVLVKRKLLIIAMTVATALLSAAYTLTLPNIYSATVKVLPPQKEGAGIASMLGQMGGLAGLAAGKGGGDGDLSVGILKSRVVGEAVIKRLDLVKAYRVASVKEAWNKVNGAVKAQTGKEGIIYITAEDTDPKIAALLANTIADELGRTMVRLNLTKAGSERIFLEKRLEEADRDLKAAEEALKKFSEKHNVVELDAQAAMALSGVSRLKLEISSKEVQLAALTSQQTEESYEVRALRASVQQLKAQLAQLLKKTGSVDAVPQIGHIPEVGIEYTRLKREYKSQEKLYESLTTQYELAKLSETKDSSSLQILDAAVVPDAKSGPNRAPLVLMSTLVAFVTSALIAFALEYLERMPQEQRKALDELVRQAVTFRRGEGSSRAQAPEAAPAGNAASSD